jgi:hypothetical protein
MLKKPDYTLYNGSWITCGSYALLNAASISNTYLIDIENSSGATFGVNCLASEWGYTRLLTPMKDFNSGIDEAVHLWGLESEHSEYGSPGEFIDVLDTGGKAQYLIGPVNMETLSYLPLSQMYRSADHYVALICNGNGTLILVDSEGIPGIKTDVSHLYRILNVKGIPESEGTFHVRKIWRSESFYPVEQRIRYTVKKAAENLSYAKVMGQGPQAFLICLDTISNAKRNLWKESLLYDLEYVMQRRLMMSKLIHNAELICSSGLLKELYSILYKQIETTASCKSALFYDKGISDYLNEMAILENELTEKWKVWVQNDWN